MQHSQSLERVAVLAVVAAVLAAAAAGGLAATTGTAAATPPPPPAAYYGSLTVNGDPAPAGVVVTARIDGEVRGRLTTSQQGAYGGPGAFDGKLQVDGTDADDGNTVHFFVGGVEAAATVEWQSADVRRVDLAVSGNVTLPGDGEGNGGDGDGGSGGGGGGGGGNGGRQDDEESWPDVFVQPGENGSTGVRVDSARAGQPVEVDVLGGDDANVSVDGLTVTTSRNASFSLEVAASEEPPPDAPALNDSGGAVGYLRVDHDVPDEDVSEVAFTFRVKKSRLAERGIAPADVVLYRYHDGSWQTLETSPSGETATHYRFEAASPGLSVFAIGVREDREDEPGDGGDGGDGEDAAADLAVADADLAGREVGVGGTVTVTATVENRGEADGEATVSLVVGGATVGEKSVSVPAGESRRVTFTYRGDEPGEYDVRVGNASAGRLAVTEDGTLDDGDDPGADDSSGNGPPGGVLLFALVAVLVALVAVLVFRRRNRQ